ncbi:MAG: hypothetical protein ABSB50_08685 [Terracidiphilus sp.]|jgi:hypothetical protein
MCSEFQYQPELSSKARLLCFGHYPASLRVAALGTFCVSIRRIQAAAYRKAQHFFYPKTPLALSDCGGILLDLVGAPKLRLRLEISETLLMP